jgi:hypothetical protein
MPSPIAAHIPPSPSQEELRRRARGAKQEEKVSSCPLLFFEMLST